jgi:hypothetical protein
MSEKSNELKIEVKEGVIGYFDILGFKNYIKNDPDIASKNALEVILKVKTEVPQIVKSRFSNDTALLDEVKWSILSDTIVLSIPYPAFDEQDIEKAKTAKRVRWGAIMFSAIALMDYMFDQGLPIRGQSVMESILQMRTVWLENQ